MLKKFFTKIEGVLGGQRGELPDYDAPNTDPIPHERTPLRQDSKKDSSSANNGTFSSPSNSPK